MVPYEQNPHFTGRAMLLETLRKRLCETNPNQYNHRVALYGLGGIGKTQAAIEYAYRHRDDYDEVFWISAVDKNSLLSGFQKIANSLGYVAKEDDGPIEMANYVLARFRQRGKWLLVIDNLDELRIVGDAHSTSEFCYLPDVTNGGHTLITTRDPNAIGIPAQGLEVGSMEVEDAVKYLLHRCQLHPDDNFENLSEIEEAEKIVDELGCLPLAIEQAAAYIREECR